MDTTYISLYSGAGGLDLGFRRAMPRTRCITYVECEATAIAVLVSNIKKGRLDEAPIWTDGFTFRPERADWIIGGPPCQPFSVAGKQRGADDPRNLWPLTLRMVEQVQPVGCFFENVPSKLSMEYIYNVVIPGLQFLGYKVEVGLFSAREVGAPHKRERVFILGYANSKGLEGRVQSINESSDQCVTWPPSPEGDWSKIKPEFYPATSVESQVRRVVDGVRRGLDTTQRLRLLGNAVVPQTAERAFKVLYERVCA